MERKATILNKLIPLLFVFFFFTLVLNAFTLQPVSKPDATEVIAQTPTPTIQATKMLTPTSSKNEVTPTALPSPTASATSTPDMEAKAKLEELVWSFMEMAADELRLIETIEVPEKTQIKTLRLTPLIFIPLRTDFILEKEIDIQVIPVPEKFGFQLHKIKTYLINENTLIKFGLLANTFNTLQTWLIATPLEIADLKGNRVVFSEVVEGENVIVTFSGTRDDIYPNKIENILTALYQLTSYQQRNGAFQASYDYSYLGLIGLGQGEYYGFYKDGLNKYRIPIRGNGICSIATGLSTLMTAENGSDQIFLEKHLHQDLYHQGPYSFPSRKVDSAVEFGPKPHQKFDLRWTQTQTAYLKFDVHLFPTGFPYTETWPAGLIPPSDLGLLVSMSYSEELLEQSMEMSALKEELNLFRDTKHEHELKSGAVSNEAKYFSLSNKNTEKIARLLFDVESINSFGQELKDDEIFQDFIAFVDTVNSYKEDGKQTLNAFLKESPWRVRYESKSDKTSLQINQIIYEGTRNQIPGEPLQCVGFVMMLTDFYPSLNMPDISRASADVAGKLVPEYAYGTEGQYSTGYGETVLVGMSLEIEDFNPGDVFVFKDYPGHVGVILAKKDGKLLVADSNRLWDGRVRIFMVNENSFDEVFGVQKYIVLGHSSGE